jgi:DNA-binding LacI/PurR family transcriptional regulator
MPPDPAGSARPAPARRPTIADIARSAGVSKSAVSYALNGQQGISAATAERILAVANELGWRPNRAARSLRAATAGACGVVLAGGPSVHPFGPYFSDLFSGIEGELRNWWAERRVDGVILVNLRAEDPRIPFLEDLGMPAVVIGGPAGTGRLPHSATDDAGGMREMLRYPASARRRRPAVRHQPGDAHRARRRCGRRPLLPAHASPGAGRRHADHDRGQGLRGGRIRVHGGEPGAVIGPGERPRGDRRRLLVAVRAQRHLRLRPAR